MYLSVNKNDLAALAARSREDFEFMRKRGAKIVKKTMLLLLAVSMLLAAIFATSLTAYAEVMLRSTMLMSAKVNITSHLFDPFNEIS